MSLSKLVVNASPIISLAKIGHADLLLDLSGELVVPKGVFEEIVTYKESDPAIQWVTIRKEELIKDVTVPDKIFEWNLGKGESEVIAYSIKNKEFTVAIDDKAAKKCAELYGIKVKGTISIIVNAKSAGLIPEIKPLLLNLKSSGFRIADFVIDSALRLANEI